MNNDDGHELQPGTSLKKIQANRQNSVNSTGPKTASGKAYSSGNAITHGLTATRVVIDRIDGEGAQERYDALHRQIFDYFNPQDPIAEFRVKMLVDTMWRLQRYDSAEAALLEQVHLRAAENALLRRTGVQGIADKSSQDVASSLPNSRRLALVVDRLTQIRNTIRDDEVLSLDLLKELMNFFPADPFLVEAAEQSVTVMARILDSNAPPVEPLRRNVVEHVTTMLSQKLQELQTVQQALEECEEAHRQARLSDWTQASGQLEVLLRFRTAAHKQFESLVKKLGGKRTKQEGARTGRGLC
jgi:hypothetical protein